MTTPRLNVGDVVTLQLTPASDSLPELDLSDDTIQAVIQGNPCPADLDGDGLATSGDFFAFLTAFFNSSSQADVNGDGIVTSQDFFDFLAAFFAGC